MRASQSCGASDFSLDVCSLCIGRSCCRRFELRIEKMTDGAEFLFCGGVPSVSLCSVVSKIWCWKVGGCLVRASEVAVQEVV